MLHIDGKAGDFIEFLSCQYGQKTYNTKDLRRFS